MSGLSTTQSLVWENQLAVPLLFRAFRQRPHHLTSVRSSGRDGLNPVLSKGQMGSLWKIDPLGQLRRGVEFTVTTCTQSSLFKGNLKSWVTKVASSKQEGTNVPWASMILVWCVDSKLPWCWKQPSSLTVVLAEGLMKLNHCYLGPLCILALLDAMYFKWLYSRGERWGKQLSIGQRLWRGGPLNFLLTYTHTHESPAGRDAELSMWASRALIRFILPSKYVCWVLQLSLPICIRES